MTATSVSTVLSHLSGPADPELELVLFPGAGAGPSSFAGWRDMVPPTWRLRSVCFPGREIRFGEPFAADAGSLAEEIAEAVAAHSRAPIVLAGHSLGALWVLETAGRLPAPPRMVATAGCESPVPGRRILTAEASEDDDRRFIRQLLAALGITDDESLEQLVDISVPILRADIALAATWIAPTRPVDCPVVSYFGTEDPMSTLPWSAHTTAGAETVSIEGDHYFFQNAVDVVTADLVGRIRRIS
jgi:surfactin synthase thioesterase subunit